MNATPMQLISAYKKLTPGDLATLRGYARKHIRGTSFAQPNDLIQETMTRALEGVRKWPLQVPFGLFFCLAMRSVADADRTQGANQLIAQLPAEFNIEERVGDTSTGSSVEDRLILLERLREAQEAIAIARAALGEDHDAQRVIDGIVLGASPREMRAELGATERDFDAARQRAGRRLREAGAIIKQRGEQDVRPAPKPCDDTPKASRASSAPAPIRRLKR